VSSTRVYLAVSWAALAQTVAAGPPGGDVRIDSGGDRVPAHTVTDRLRAEFPEADEEELEYLALTAAAQASLWMIPDTGPYARVVVAADVAAVEDAPSEDPTSVVVPGGMLRSEVRAVHVDEADAAADVRAARAALAQRLPDADERVERCLDHELAWYASQEVGDLLGRG
jgi:hypothetical protein